MADHEIKLVATLDTTNINSNIEQTRVNQQGSNRPGGGSSTMAVAGSLGVMGSVTQQSMALLQALRVLQLQFKRVSMPINELVREYNISHQHIKGINKTIGTYRSNMQKNLDNIRRQEGVFTRSLKDLSNSANQAANSMRRAARTANQAANGGGFGGLGMKLGKGGGFGGMAGRMASVAAVYSAYSNTKRLFETTDPEGKSAFSKISSALDWVISPFEKMAKEAEKDAKIAQESKQRLAEFNEQLKRLNELAKNAGLDRYSRQQKAYIDVITASELPEYLKEHGDKLEKLKDKYNKMNDRLSRGEVPVLGIDNFLKEMQQMAHEVDIEQGIFDKAASKMKQLNEETKKLAEETERLGKEYARQSQSHQDAMDSDKRASTRRYWSSMSMDELLNEKAPLNAQWNKSNEAIQKIDAEIKRLQEFYDLQDTNEGRKDIMQKINEQLQQRGRLVSQRNEALGDLDRINGMLKAFDEATKTLEEKSQELQDSEAFKEWKEGLKGRSGSSLFKELKEAKEQRGDLYESIVYDYDRAARERDPNKRKQIKEQIEVQLKQMGDVDSRISELESKTKVGLDDPTAAMTSMGRMGMYMSGTESALRDPKLEKLDHISMTLWKIERNTQNQTVSRFL